MAEYDTTSAPSYASLCGLPIITEKRSSSSLKIFPQIFERNSSDNTTTPHDVNHSYMNGHSVGHHNDNDSRDRKNYDVETFTIPITTEIDDGAGYGSAGMQLFEDGNADAVGRETISSGGVGTKPVSFTAMQNDNGQQFTAIMVVRYYDLVQQKYQQLGSSHSSSDTGSLGDSSSEDQDQDQPMGKVLVTTTITTVADIYVHISLAQEPFKGDYSEIMKGDGQVHQVTLSATTTSCEVNGNIASAKIEMNRGSNDDLNANTHENGDVDSEIHSKSDGPISKSGHNRGLNRRYTWSDVEAQLVFSSNGKHLTCLIPRPIQKYRNTEMHSEDKNAHGGDDKEYARNGEPSQSSLPFPIKLPGLSTVVTFSLRPPTIETDTEATMVMNDTSLPQPKYLLQSEKQELAQKEAKATKSHSNRSSSSTTSSSSKKFQPGMSAKLLPPIPCNPQILSLDPTSMMNMENSQQCSKLVSQITCLCDVDPTPNIQSSLLLAGCTDGSILLIAQKRATVLGLLYSCGTDNHNENEGGMDEDVFRAVKDRGWVDKSEGICVLKYSIDSPSYPSADGNVDGKLLGVRRDGKVIIYSTSFSDYVELQNGNGNRSLRVEKFDQNGENGKKEMNGHDSALSNKMQHLKWEGKKYAFEMTINEFCDSFALPYSSRNNIPHFSNGTWIDSNTFALLARPLDVSSVQGERNHTPADSRTTDMKFNETIVQVCSIGMCEREISLLAKLEMNHEKLDEIKHGFFDGNLMDKSSLTDCPTTSTYIEYDKLTGCLLISSAVPLSRSSKSEIVQARNFISVWDWISCTIGFTLVSANLCPFTIQNNNFCTTEGAYFCSLDSLHSRLKICRDSGSVTLLHTFGKDIYQRDMYNLGTLAPSRYQRDFRGVENPNPIFLSDDSVAYPDLLEPSVNKEIQVGWKYSMIPPIYLTGQGPIRIAAIAGGFGRSLAIVGSRGLCVLDIHREDVSVRNAASNPLRHDVVAKFSTSCLEGFQCSTDHFQMKMKQDRWRMFSRNDESSFTVEALTWWENSNTGDDDVIVAIVKYIDTSDPCSYLVAWSSRRLGMGRLQLLDEARSVRGHGKEKRLGIKLPENFASKQMSILVDTVNEEEKRAVLLLTGVSDSGLPYLLVQLQCISDKKSGDFVADEILGTIAAEGKISSHICPLDFTFLAEASFQFNLSKAEETNENGQDCQLATLGIIHSHGTAISSASISFKKIICQANVVHLFSDDANDGTVTDRIVKVWLSTFNKTSEIGTWTWSFMKSNGGIFSWAVGGIKSKETSDRIRSQFALHHSVSNFGITSDGNQCLKGSIVDERTSILGPLPSADHRHLLYSGQKCRISHGIELGLGKRTSFWLYGVADFDVGIPSSTGSFLLSLSRIVEFEMNAEEDAANALIVKLSHNIQQMHSYETTFAGLRAIVSFLTELEAENESQNTREEIETCKFLQKMQAALVRITISALFQLQFVSLFLNVGRQLEPHHFHSLFPLSLSTKQNISNQYLSLQDLFDMAVADGSFSVPAAALPLFSDRRTVHNLCVNLLHHCISTIFSFSNVHSVQVGYLREEFRSMQQLYCYTVKLEDSEYATNQSILNGSLDEDGNTISNEETYDSNNYNASDAYESTADDFSLVHSVSGQSFEEHQEPQYKEDSPSKIRKLAALFTPLVKSKKKESESAISAAASTFIFSGYKKDSCYDPVESSDSSAYSDSIQNSQLEEEFINHITGDGPMSFGEDDKDRLPLTSSGLIGMSICATVFFSGDMINGLTNVATLSLVLCTEGGGVSESIHHLATRRFANELTKTSLTNSIYILKEMNMLQRDCIDSDYPEAKLLGTLIHHISEQWDSHITRAVIETITGVLSRHNRVPEITCFAPLLCLILVATCHVSDNLSLIFDVNGEEDIESNTISDLSEILNLALDFSESSKL